MKCKICGKKGVRLAHWRNEHPDYMARKRREGTARRRAEKASGRAPTVKSRKGGKRRRTKQDASGSILEGFPPPPPPDGYVVESVTYRRA